MKRVCAVRPTSGRWRRAFFRACVVFYRMPRLHPNSIAPRVRQVPSPIESWHGLCAGSTICRHCFSTACQARTCGMPVLNDPQQRPTAPASRWRFWFALALIVGLVWLLGTRQRGSMRDPDAVPRAVTPRGDLAADERATIDLFRAVSPSVVYITTLTRDIFSLNLLEMPQGAGSGFIWDHDGHIITNF